MKFEILLRGPARPDAQTALTRAAALAAEVRAHGHEAAIWFAMWSTPDRPVLSTIVNSPIVDHCLFIRPPSTETILEHCNGAEYLDSGRTTRNTFHQYYLSKIAIDTICSAGAADYIIHTRPDLDIRLGRHFTDWIQGEKYCTLHKKTGGSSFINDQFAVADAATMRKAWDWGSQAELGALIQKAKIPEDVLDQMVAYAELSVETPPFEIWEFDPARNAAG